MKKSSVLSAVLLFLALTLPAGNRFHSGYILSAAAGSGVACPAGHRLLLLSVELDRERSLWKGDYSLIVRPSGKEVPCLAVCDDRGNTVSSGTIPAQGSRRAGLLFAVPENTEQAALRFLLFTTGEPLRFFPVRRDDKE